jgi:hypothetical protein
MPDTARPVACGFSARKRFSAAAGTCHIACDFRRVASGEIRNAQPSLHRIDLFGFQNFSTKAGLL